MKLIHCADLHLDSKMGKYLTPEVAKARRQELMDTFERMITYAQENGIKVIMISGDLFDSKNITARAAVAVKNAIALHPDITFMYLKGNHDCSSFLSRFQLIPDNLKLFSEDWKSYDFEENVTISGIELSEKNREKMSAALRLRPSRLNIVMLHGQIVRSSYRPPVQGSTEENIFLNDLKGKYIDYLALGHLHSFNREALDDRGIWAYSGCLEGRGFDEIGAKGFVELETTQDGKLREKFIPFAKRTLHRVDVDLTGISQSHDIEARINLMLLAKGIPSTDMVHLNLKGQVDLGLNPDVDYLSHKFGDNFLFFKLDTKDLRRAIHPERYANDVSLKGEFVRTVMKMEDVDSDDREMIALYGLKALAGEELL